MSRSALMVCAALLIGATGAQAARLHPVPEAAQRIKIDLPTLLAAEAVQIQYTGFWHREDYARFSTAQAQAEIVYAAADPHENAALEVPLTFARARDSFEINAQGTLALGVIAPLDQPDRTIFYQPYALKDRGWACVAVKSEWNHIGRDPRNRPGRAMFGYICDKRGGSMTNVRAQEMVRAITTTGSKVDWQDDGTRLAEPGPVDNSRFPFDFGVHFNDNDGNDRNH